MTFLQPAQLLKLFGSFECRDLMLFYLARDRAASSAARAFNRDDARQLSDLQALLRAATAIALVNELPSAVFVESAVLWRAKLVAHRRLLASGSSSVAPTEGTPAPHVSDPFAGVTFDLFTYAISDFQKALLTAASLPMFRPNAGHHFDAALAAAKQIKTPDVEAWCEHTTPASLEALLKTFWRPLPDVLPQPNALGAHAQPELQPASSSIASLQSASSLPPVPPPSLAQPESSDIVAGLTEALKSGIGYYGYPSSESDPFHQLVKQDPITRGCLFEGDGNAVLPFRSVADALAGQPAPDPIKAPIAALIYAFLRKSPEPGPVKHSEPGSGMPGSDG